MKTLAIFLMGLLMVNCSNNNNNDEVALEGCGESTLIQKLTEDIPVTVKGVKEGEPFYNGSKIYYEVDAEAYLPEVFEQNGEKYLRLFPINKINDNMDSQIIVNGTVTSCLTGNHGLMTNNYIAFYLLEQ